MHFGAKQSIDIPNSHESIDIPNSHEIIVQSKLSFPLMAEMMILQYFALTYAKKA